MRKTSLTSESKNLHGLIKKKAGKSRPFHISRKSQLRPAVWWQFGRRQVNLVKINSHRLALGKPDPRQHAILLFSVAAYLYMTYKDTQNLRRPANFNRKQSGEN